MNAPAQHVRQLPAAFLTEDEAVDLLRRVYRQAFFHAAEHEPHADNAADSAAERAATRHRFFGALVGLFTGAAATVAHERGVLDASELAEIMSGDH